MLFLKKKTLLFWFGMLFSILIELQGVVWFSSYARCLGKIRMKDVLKILRVMRISTAKLERMPVYFPKKLWSCCVRSRLLWFKADVNSQVSCKTAFSQLGF